MLNTNQNEIAHCVKRTIVNASIRIGVALVQWLWEETHVPQVMGLNPSIVYWMEIFSHLFVELVMVFACKDENKRKRGWVCTYN